MKNKIKTEKTVRLLQDKFGNNIKKQKILQRKQED